MSNDDEIGRIEADLNRGLEYIDEAINEIDRKIRERRIQEFFGPDMVRKNAFPSRNKDHSENLYYYWDQYSGTF